MKRRDRDDLTPTGPEIFRRISVELDFCQRLVSDIDENPDSYLLGEYYQDIHDMSKDFLADTESMISNLNDYSFTNKTIVAKARVERLIELSGDSKTNIWRRLREKAEKFIFGGGSIPAKLSALAEYSDYGVTVIESVENLVLESNTGKSVSEGIGLLRQAFSAAARRLSNES